MSDFNENKNNSPEPSVPENVGASYEAPTFEETKTEKTSLVAYFKSKEFWSLNLLFFFGGLLGLFFFLYAVLPFITRKGSEKPLPALTEKSLPEAIKILEKMNLRYQVDSLTYDPDIPPLTVLSQKPAPGHKVKPRRTIYLNVNKKQPTLVEIPPYSEFVSLEDYIHYLQARGFRIGRIDSVVRNDAPGQVIGVYLQNKKLRDGDKIPKGSVVNVQVSKYPVLEKEPSDSLPENTH